ncbi:hypothetical protein IFR05_008329 [Cadophora sp. M221]|nr:hypothetical protein IFR05_008329 [Cadophora sp. M221]
MDPTEVESYLEKNLSWRAVSAIEDGDDPLSSKLIIMARLPQTKISVAKGSVHQPDDDSELSTYDKYTPMWRATQGKPGGAREGD